jgi:hypothetical protein
VLRTALVLAVTLACSLAACGDDDGGGGGGGGGGGLAGAMDAVGAGEASQAYFAYSDLAAIGEEAPLPRPGQPAGAAFRRWSIPAAMGAPALVLDGARSPVDAFAAQRALTIGAPGDSASRLDGVEQKLDPGALEPLGRATSFADGTLVVATSDAALREAAGGDGASLGDSPAHAAAADCLGDVLAAALMPARGVGADERVAELIAVGVRGGKDPAEVLCVVGDAVQAAEAVPRLRSHLQPQDNDRVATLDVDSGESDDRHWSSATITLKADEPLGYLYRIALQQLQLRSWLAR